VLFRTISADEAEDKGKLLFEIDDDNVVEFNDGGVDLYTGYEYLINNVSVLSNNTLGSGIVNSSLTGLGTISSGTWNGNPIVNTYLDTGISDNKIVEIDSASVTDNDYAKFTANGLEGRSYTEVKTDLSLNNVENVAISTWVGTSNITTVGQLGGLNVDVGIGIDYNTNDASGSLLVFDKRRGGTVISPVACQDGDIIGRLWYTFANSFPTAGITAGFIDMIIDDVSNGSEDASIHMKVMKAGAVTDIAQVKGTGINLITGTDYLINDVSIINSTTIGSSVINSSLTSVGTLTSGTWQGTAIGDTYITSAATWNATGISNSNYIIVDSASVNSGEYGRFTASGLESRTIAEIKSDLSLTSSDVGLGNVENTALSTWSGSNYITNVGNINDNLAIVKADATTEPAILLMHKERSGGPALTGDDLFNLRGDFKNSSNSTQIGIQIIADIVDATNGSEDISLDFQTMQAGVNASRLKISSGVTIPNGDFTVDTKTLYVDSANNRLGVGTISPDMPMSLNLDGGSANISFRISDVTKAYMGVANSSSNLSNIDVTDDLTIRANTNNLVLTARNASGSIKFATQQADSLKMEIANNGNVGIGTANPKSKLDVIHTTTNIVGDYEDTSAVLNIFGGEDKRCINIITQGNHSGSATHHRYPGMVFHPTRDNTIQHDPGGAIVFTDRPGDGGYANQVRQTDIFFQTSARHHFNRILRDVCTISADGYVRGINAFQNDSDDRIKHNEKNINKGLNVINKLQAKEYFKTSTLFDENGNIYDSNHNFNLNIDGLPIDASGEVLTDVNKEVGFIAQDVFKIDELKHAVQEGDLVSDASGNMYKNKFGLCYEEIFVMNVVATQELSEIVTKQQKQINNLQNLVSTLLK